MTEPWYRSRTLLAILAGSLAIKLFLAFAVDGDAAVADEGVYLGLARRLAAEGVFGGTFRPPLYPAFMALLLKTGYGTLGIRLAQAALSVASIILVYRLAGRFGGDRMGLVAAGLVAFDPVLVAFSHRLWSETLFIVLLLAALDLIARPPERQVVIRWAGAGLLLGLAGLTRPMILTFLPFLLLWGAWQVYPERHSWRGAAVRSAVLVCACMLIILPWTWRNYQRTQAIILVDSNGPFNMLVGTEAEASFVDKDDFWSKRFGSIEGESYQALVARDAGRAQDAAMQQAVANIASDPLRFLAKCWWEAGHLWTMDSFLLRHLRNGWYGDVPGWVAPVATLVSAPFFVAVVLGALVGLLCSKHTPLRGLTIVLLVHSTLLFGVTYSLSRYSVPLHPLLGIFAAGAVTGHGKITEHLRRLPVRRLLAGAVVLLLLLSAWVRDIPLMYDMVAHGGANHRFILVQTPESAGDALP